MTNDPERPQGAAPPVEGGTSETGPETTKAPEAAAGGASGSRAEEEAKPAATAAPGAPEGAEAPARASPGAASAAARAAGLPPQVRLGIGLALVVLPCVLLAYLLGRPMTIATDLGFPTMIPGQSGVALHPSTFWFYVGVLCLLLVGAGAGVVFDALFPGRLGLAESPEQRGFVAWLYRHRWSLGLLVIGVLVLFPTLGRAGLWDPWESHYGLVGLRMVEQDDWISTCDMGWAEWFFSKPILLFWLMGLGLVGLGQDAAADGNPPLIEWAFRLPIALLALAAVMAVYLLASRRWSKRAGFIAGLALLTMPQFFLIARQAMTDMPFVAPLTVALCFLGLALGEPEERPAVAWSFFGGRFRFSSFHLLLVAITAVALPQALLVVTHNKDRALAVYKANAPEAELRRLAADRAVNDDVIFWGSLGQAEDGNDRCDGLDCSRSPERPDRPQLNPKFKPETRLARPFPGPGLAHRVWGAIFLLFWVGALVAVSWRSSREVPGPTQRDVYLYGFYLAAAIATLAKGLLGFAIPGLIILLYLLVSGEWRELARFRIVRGLLVFLAAAGPWYVMMVVRHGDQWFNQFIVHDHFKRSASGVHGDRGPLGYFVQQLGIGTFPWAAFIPMALFAFLWLRWERKDPERPAEGERVALLASLWGLSMFAFFTVMSTKFHHYVFPALPAFALCVGLLLDRMIDERARWTYLVTFGALAVFAFVARDLTTTIGSRLRGYERLIQLFMYKYDRIWPDPKVYGPHLDYSKDLIVFSAVFAGLLLLFLLPVPRRPAPGAPSTPLLEAASRILLAPRRFVLALFAAAATVFAGWGLHVYFNQISPHWSEGYLVKLFYEDRRGPDERLIAYSLNWHGENCYTANRAKILMTEHDFQREWDDFPEWLKRHKGRTYYFIMGKGGSSGLKSKLDASIPGAWKTVEVISDEMSNKYELARGRLCAPEQCPPEDAPPPPPSTEARAREP
jgi:4-amino-4-deoxy-L-arabinose transferase-like glycosyltransferase